MPAVNGAKVMIEAFNKGTAPAPYNKAGFGGMKIEPIYVDENGGATKQVQELRNLYDREKVDAVVGYVGSGDCLAVAPVAEEMKKFLVLYDCGTPRIFEDGKYRVRVPHRLARGDGQRGARPLPEGAQHQGRQLQPDQPGLRLGPGLAQGLHLRAWSSSIPDAKAGADLLPKFGAGQYGTEISALLAKPADVTHSSLWGGDLQAFILQAGAARPVQAHAGGVLGRRPRAAGPRRQDARRRDPRRARRLRPDVAEVARSTTGGGRSTRSAYNVYPVQAPYRMAQALLGLKLAVEKAMAANGGKKPTPEQLAAALRNSEWESPAGRIRMTLGDGHQAIAGHRHRPHQVRRGEEDGRARSTSSASPPSA